MFCKFATMGLRNPLLNGVLKHPQDVQIREREARSCLPHRARVNNVQGASCASLTGVNESDSLAKKRLLWPRKKHSSGNLQSSSLMNHSSREVPRILGVGIS